MKNKIILKFGGQPLSIAKTTALERRIMEWLDRQPDDELFHSWQFASEVGVMTETVRCLGNGPALSAYRHRLPGHAAMWGNPAAVAEYRRQLENR
ncbi:MAG TPA: hypothetical protein VG206_02940 [Terriglobia bacterium]|nr:hypothetical protein [Terriglobia bacterium]